MFRWYVINTYSGHEKKVKQNLEHRVSSLNQTRSVRQVVVPTETVQEMKDNQKISVEKRTMPGYVLVNMDLNEDSWQVVKGTPGVTGLRRRLERADPADPGRGRPAAAPRGRGARAVARPVRDRRVRQGHLRPAVGLLRRDLRDQRGRRASSRSSCRSSGARRPSRSATIRSRRSRRRRVPSPHSWPRKSSQRSSCRRPEARPRRRRPSAPRWASTASTSWSSSRRSTPRRRATWARRSPWSSPSTRTARSPSSRRRRRPRC